MRPPAPATRARLTRLLICLLLLAPSVLLVRAVTTRSVTGRPVPPAAKAVGRQEAAAAGLPGLKSAPGLLARLTAASRWTAAAFQSTSYSAVADYSADENPAGVWSYGYRPQGGPFIPYANNDHMYAYWLECWSITGDDYPLIIRNNSGATASYAGITQPVDLLNLHPGFAGERSVVRWTAPASNTYQFEGRFEGIDTAGTTTDVLVTHDGAAVFSGQVGGYGATAPFSLSRAMGAGDTLEFSVGVGPNGTYDNDSTGLAVVITPQYTYLSDLAWSYSYNDYYTTTRDLSVDGTPIKLDGMIYEKGLGVHAYSDVRYQLAGGYSAFITTVGLDDAAVSSGSVTFEIWADGQKLYESGVMTPQTGATYVNVSVAGKQELKLVVTQAGDGPGWDHADWAGALLIPAPAPTPTPTPAGQTVSVTATVPTAGEDGSRGVYTVTRAGDTSQPLTVNYTVSGTATPGLDYFALPGSVTIPAGASSQTITLFPGEDSTPEPDETVILTLTSGTGYTVGTPASATITFFDNDAVSITSPAWGASFDRPASITITANAVALNSGSSIGKVEFFANNLKLGEDTTAPYSFVWNSPPTGYYQLKAVGTFNNGATATSSVIDMTVYGPPSVSILSPADGAVFTAPASFNIEVAATDPMGPVYAVEFFASGQKIGEDTTAPYSFAWNNVPAGTYHLMARALLDAGSSVDSGLVNITVGSAPAVGIVSPAPGATFTAPATVNIDANASSSIGLGKVEFFRDGVKLGEDTTAPYSFAWTNVAAGSYSLTARATDTNGAATTSDPAAITVSDNAPPTVQLTGPAANTSFAQGSAVTLAAEAADADGSVSKVEFFADGTKLGEDTTAPYGFVWSSPPAGGHSLTAVATDNLGAAGTSAAVAINVEAVDFLGARLDPVNRTGAGGVDPLSRNFNWTLPLVALPGRSGLDLGLALSYNSLVWTKSGNYVLFDGDGGWPSPGFRLGFAVVQTKFLDAQAQKAAYMLVTPSGARVSLRQTATPTVYEAGDSSYLQLTEEADGSLTLVSPGGTRMRYEFLGGVYKCTEVLDRNGNFITVAYNASGNIYQVTDTLGRVIEFGYDTAGYLSEIKQTWRREVEGGPAQPAPETHYWARFSYANQTLGLNFDRLTPVGAQDGQSLRVLKQVKLADDSYYVFNYTTWGQVYQVANYAKDGGLLNYTTLNLPLDAATLQGDCPRPTERRDWAAYWNGDADGTPATSEEAVTTYSVPESATWTSPESNQQQSGTLTKVMTPDGTEYREYSRASGWDKGLTLLSEVWATEGGAQVKKKWTSTDWTQDDEALQYQQNPRVRETNVYDSNNDGSQHARRRTEVIYTSFGLPADVREYDSDATTILRRTHTEYMPASVSATGAYTLLRIIGLPQKREVYGLEDGQEKLYSKMTYEYDLANTTDFKYLTNAGAVTQHKADYGPGFTTRGNVCVVRRWDVSVTNGVTNEGDVTKSVAAAIGYSTTGSVLFTSDALGHKTSVSYTDSDGGMRAAYPTQVTDPDGFTSSTWYDYEMGVVTKSETPKPNETTDQDGPVVTRLYDREGRLLKVTNSADAAYTKWEYGTSGLYVKQSTQVDTGLAETFVMSVLDGAGHVRGSLRERPGGYTAQRFAYDIMGQQTGKSNPIEVTVNADDKADVGRWVPTGDDATANGGTGWVYTQTSYDWKGRPLLVTNPGSPVSTKEFLYGGCGCAGGQTVTMRDEAGRRQRVIYDTLGRVSKVQVLSQQDKGTAFSDGPDVPVYSTTVNAYNTLDKTVEMNTFAGASESDPAKIQKTALEYDGHGRLRSRKDPMQTRAVVYEYADDDTVRKVLTPREASGDTPQDVTVTFTRNNRHLITKVEYVVPSALSDPASANYVPAAPTVEMSYDGTGRRIRMMDGLGVVDYTSDAVGRLIKETRTFNDPGNPSMTGVVKDVGYDYTLSNELKSVTDPAGNEVTYGYDSAGQLGEVKGALNGTELRYAYDMKYRAWGAIKSLSYGNGRSLSMSYNQRLNVSHFEIGGLVSMDYRYTTAPGGSDDDGLVKYAQDMTQANSPFDRAYRYDLAGRLAEALTGTEARGGSAIDGPYRETYGYDAWNNMTGRTTRNWYDDVDGQVPPITQSSGRKTTWDYDAAGNVLRVDENDRRFKWDAAGRMVEMTDTVTRLGRAVTRTQKRSYDGDGRWVKEVKMGLATYNVRASALGGEVLTEFDAAGQKLKTNVYARGELLARQQGNEVVWEHGTPFGTGEWETAPDGALRRRTELDPAGADVGVQPPGGAGTDPEAEPLFPLTGDPTASTTGVLIDGAEMPDVFVSMILNFGNGHGSRGGGGGVGGQVTAGNYVWVDAWEDLPSIPGDPDNNQDGGTTVAKQVGHFVALPGSSSLRTEAGRLSPQKTVDLTPEVQKALSTCLGSIFKGFNVKVNSFTVAGVGKDGKVNVSYEIGGDPLDVDITTSTSKDGATLARESKLDPLWTAGYTDPRFPYMNYVASDLNEPNLPAKMVNGKLRRPQVTGPEPILELRKLLGDNYLEGQFHEFANSLSAFLSFDRGRDPKAFGDPRDKVDPDTGYRLDKCMLQELKKAKK